jgi:alkylation response protein AidB-like acyl-CoA dehydrogenase
MDVRLSPEHRALLESAAQMVDRLGPETVRDLEDQERTAKLDAAIAASGWREMRADGEGGAPLTSAVEVGLVAEELGAGLADAAFIGPVLAADLRRLATASPASSAETVAFTPDLSAVARGGEAAVAFDAAGATNALVLADAPAGASVLTTVEIASMSVGPDLTRSVGGLPPTSVAGVAGQPIAAADLVRWHALGLAVASADLVGTMRGAINLATDYAKTRNQFGTSIGSFQAIQHLLADAYVAMEGSRSTALHAAWAVDALPADEALAAAAAAKAYCARAARDVCETVIQVHGGIGNTWECLAHVYLRRALASSDLLGGVGPSLARVLAHHGVSSYGGGADGLR